MIDLANKVAFITGAAHGQGRATALALAKEGVHIVAFDIAGLRSMNRLSHYAASK